VARSWHQIAAGRYDFGDREGSSVTVLIDPRILQHPCVTHWIQAATWGPNRPRPFDEPDKPDIATVLQRYANDLSQSSYAEDRAGAKIITDKLVPALVALAEHGRSKARKL
jgi:hypothetical protein